MEYIIREKDKETRAKRGECFFLRSDRKGASVFFSGPTERCRIGSRIREKDKETKSFGQIWDENGSRWRGGQQAGSPEKAGVFFPPAPFWKFPGSWK